MGMAFGAEEQHGLDVHIVPVGINYTYPADFRKEVLINFDDPFSIRELTDLHKANPAKALLAFNEKVEAGLKRQVIIVNDPANDNIAEQLLVMGRNNVVLPFFKWRFDSDERRMLEKDICDRINTLAASSPESLETLKEKTGSYFSLLKKEHIMDQNIARKLDYGFLRYLTVILGLPVFIAGYLANLLPFIIPGIICKTFIRDPRFFSSVYIGIGTMLYLIYFPIVMGLSVWVFGWYGILVGFAVPLSGYLVLFYMEIIAERLRTLLYWIKKVSNPELIENLARIRVEIMSDVRVSEAELNRPNPLYRGSGS